MHELKTCKHCGNKYLLSRKGYCEACGNFLCRNGRLPERSEMRSSRRKDFVLCTNCKSDYAINGVMCRACYLWQKKHGTPRPLYLTKILCMNCNVEMADCKGLCARCYEYKRRHNKSRPRYFFASECMNCGDANVHAKGLCLNCYEYKRRFRRNRPKELCEKYAKCECGKPAMQEVTVKVGSSTAKYKLCADCLKEEQRSIY